MKIHLGMRWALVVCATLTTASLFAEPTPSLDRATVIDSGLDKHARRLYGKDAPRSNQLAYAIWANPLPQRDREALVANNRAQQPDDSGARRILADACLDLARQDSRNVVNAYALAAYFERADIESERARVEFYERQIQLLSAEGREAVTSALRIINDALVEGSITNWRGYATEQPGLFVDLMRRGCERHRSASGALETLQTGTAAGH